MDCGEWLTTTLSGQTSPASCYRFRAPGVGPDFACFLNRLRVAGSECAKQKRACGLLPVGSWHALQRRGPGVSVCTDVGLGLWFGTEDLGRATGLGDLPVLSEFGVGTATLTLVASCAGSA